MGTHAFWVSVHALAVVALVNRYIGGRIVRYLRRAHLDETTESFLPSVTVVIPLYNEGAAIQATLRSVLASAYPRELLRVICVDDASSDDSFALAAAICAEDPRLSVLRNARNHGKRLSINEAVRAASGEIIVSIDSDVVVDPAAIRELVRRFANPRIGAVGGWVDVRNKHDNWLTRMQVVKYWYAYYVMKNIECAFQRVMALSGCLTAYRRSVLLELAPILDARSILGVPIKYGEDRYLTRQIVKAGYFTVMTLDARCQTFVPRTLAGYFSQQLRWRRSNLVDYAAGCGHMWRLNPLLAINYFSMALVMIAYPAGVFRALATGHLLHAIALHLCLSLILGLHYAWSVRRWPARDRVGALSYAPLALCMPVTYALLTPLALFSLDSSSWETR
ncbi:MAG TPA: glycosyltransferase [Kofleriaceae bacterium]|jgi:cellulose synthase/poly-beta-1,6-N-acetylglucosamine synthase-like glycosyltransferase